MPYEIRKNKNKWQVVKKGTAKVMGTHPSRYLAEQQLKALYANEKSS